MTMTNDRRQSLDAYSITWALLWIASISLASSVSWAQPGRETMYLTNTGMLDGSGVSITDLYRLELDADTLIANMELLTRLPIEQADALACSPDDTKCYLIAKFQPGPFPDGGALGAYDTVTGNFELIGDLVDEAGDRIPEVVLASFSPGPEGQLYVGSMETEAIYTVDLTTAIATQVGYVAVDGTETIVNLSGADLAFTADGRLYLWTNQSAGVDAPAGLYELRMPVLPEDDFLGIYLGIGADGSDPTSHEFNGLAVRDNGLGNLVGANRFSELHEQALDGSDAGLYTLMTIDGVPGHLSGDMHHSFDCFLDARLLEDEVEAGGALEVDMRLVHNRPADVKIPLHMWVEDIAGNVIFHRKTKDMDLTWGDDLRKIMSVPIGAAALPGDYVFVLGAEAMRQGKVTVRRPFRVIDR